MGTFSDLDEKSMMLGDHEARLKNIEFRLESVDGKLDRVLAVTERAKGSWKTLATIGGSLAVVIEGLHQVSDWMHHVK